MRLMQPKMQNDISQIKGKLSALKKHRQLEAEQIAFAEKIANTLAPHFEILARGLGLLAEHFEKLEKGVDASKAEFPETQRIAGEVKVANPDDFKVKEVAIINPVDEVTIKNPPDIASLRNEIELLSKAVTEILSQEKNVQSAGLKSIEMVLSRILAKETDADLLNALAPLRFLTNNPLMPLSVRLSDGENWYKAMAGIAQQVVTASGTLSSAVTADLTDIKNLLIQIENNTDDLELDVDTINLNTDQLEAKLDTLIAKDYATETTLLLVKAELIAIKGFVDQLEGFTDGIETLLTTLNAKDFATETTLALAKTVLDNIKIKTDNLDVLLSTRFADATFTARINTLGQKTMANSTPVVLPSDQSAIPITGIISQIATEPAKSLFTERTAAPLVASTWRELINFTVPTGKKMALHLFSSLSSSAGTRSRLAVKESLATYNFGTNTFVKLFNAETISPEIATICIFEFPHF